MKTLMIMGAGIYQVSLIKTANSYDCGFHSRKLSGVCLRR